MNNAAPKILNDIVTVLKKQKIKISENVEGEGRHGSLNDEGTIKRFLQSHSKFKSHVFDVPARGFGDMLVLDYDKKTYHVVNIKTTIGSSDNATSKIGFLYAFTDIDYDDLPKSMNWKKFHKLLTENKADNPGRDYWFLSVDKNDSSNVMIRGTKQIVNWCENANPANLLQINWTKEKRCEPATRTYEEAYKVIIGGIIRCYKKAFNNLPTEWLAEIKK
jgi:hypothetical protein